MEQQRFFLFIALAIILFLLWDAWQKDYGPQPVPSVTTTQTETTSTVKAVDIPEGADIPAVVSTPGSIPQAVQQPVLPTSKEIVVETDLLRVVINTTGGDVRKVDLLEYPVDVKDPADSCCQIQIDVRIRLHDICQIVELLIRHVVIEHVCHDNPHLRVSVHNTLPCILCLPELDNVLAPLGRVGL